MTWPRQDGVYFDPFIIRYKTDPKQADYQRVYRTDKGVDRYPQQILPHAEVMVSFYVARTHNANPTLQVKEDIEL